MLLENIQRRNKYTNVKFSMVMSYCALLMCRSSCRHLKTSREAKLFSVPLYLIISRYHVLFFATATRERLIRYRPLSPMRSARDMYIMSMMVIWMMREVIASER
jgi:hypothetical protein